MLFIIGLVLAIAAAVCGIIILVNAFSEDVTQGLLCLCIPFYVLYYAFARFESDNKGLIIGIWLGGGILGQILMALSGAG